MSREFRTVVDDLVARLSGQLDDGDRRSIDQALFAGELSDAMDTALHVAVHQRMRLPASLVEEVADWVHNPRVVRKRQAAIMDSVIGQILVDPAA